MNDLIVQGRFFAGHIAKALGIMRPIVSVKIDADCRLGKPVMVTMEFHASPDEAVAVSKVMAQYNLVPVEPSAPGEV